MRLLLALILGLIIGRLIPHGFALADTPGFTGEDARAFREALLVSYEMGKMDGADDIGLMWMKEKDIERTLEE